MVVSATFEFSDNRQPEATPIDQQWYIYVLRCRFGKLYTGITTDVERRLQQHEGGTGARNLRGKGPLELVFSAPAGNRSSASRLESRIKRLPRSGKEGLVAGRLALADLVSDEAP